MTTKSKKKRRTKRIEKMIAQKMKQLPRRQITPELLDAIKTPCKGGWTNKTMKQRRKELASPYDRTIKRKPKKSLPSLAELIRQQRADMKHDQANSKRRLQKRSPGEGKHSYIGGHSIERVPRKNYWKRVRHLQMISERKMRDKPIIRGVNDNIGTPRLIRKKFAYIERDPALLRKRMTRGDT